MENVPFFYRVSYVSGGAGFLPSTVLPKRPFLGSFFEYDFLEGLENVANSPSFFGGMFALLGTDSQA